MICILLASLNSCCNPWIYMCFSGSLVRQVLCNRKSRPKPPVAPARAVNIPAAERPPLEEKNIPRQKTHLLTPLQQQSREGRDSQSSVSLINHVFKANSDSTVVREMFEMEVKNTEQAAEHRACVSTKTAPKKHNFNARPYPCVLYRSLQPAEPVPKFHSV